MITTLSLIALALGLSGQVTPQTTVSTGDALTCLSASERETRQVIGRRKYTMFLCAEGWSGDVLGGVVHRKRGQVCTVRGYITSDARCMILTSACGLPTTVCS